MKNLIIIFLIGLPTFLFGQQNEVNFELPLYKTNLPVNVETGSITFVYIFNAVDQSKDELYKSARNWFDEKYNASDLVLQIADSSSGVLYGTAFTDIIVLEGGMGEPEKMYYTIEVNVKDGKFKCVITDIMYQAYASEYDQYPEIYRAEPIIIDNLYKNNGKIKSTNLQYKENTMLLIRSLVIDLQDAMNKISYSENIRDW